MRAHSDGFLLGQLAGFLMYEAANPDAVCFTDWADEQNIKARDRTFIEVWYVRVTDYPHLGA
jgi:hypothetical protein